MTISILPKTHSKKRNLENEENTVFYFFEQSNLKKIKSITTYIANMDKTKKVVSKRRKTKQPKFIGGSDEDFMEFVNKYAVVTPYDTSDSGFRKLTPDELALLTKVMADDDKYFAENP